MNELTIIKRNGQIARFDKSKIESAVLKAMQSVGKGKYGYTIANVIADRVAQRVEQDMPISVEKVQNEVEKEMMAAGQYDVAKAYILYRERHSEARFIRERIDYMERYSNSNSNAASSSETDPNSNVAMKNVANLEGEVYKTTNRLIQRSRMKDKLTEMYPNENLAKQYVEDLEKHIIYTHDESSTPVLKYYCCAVTLYPLMMDGVGNIDGVTPTPPNDIQSFSGQVTNLAFLLSSQCKGAVAFGDYLVALNYYVNQEFGENWYEKVNTIISTPHCKKTSTIKTAIRKGMKQFIYGVNQPAGNRSYNSPFTNISFYDHNYFDALFGEFSYPDGTRPKWAAVDMLQRIFLELHRELRLIKPLTFPVTTMALLHDDKDVVDKEYKELCAEEWAKGSSFFCYMNNNPAALASCCFSKDTKLLWKSSTRGVQLTTFEELYTLPYNGNKDNLKIFHNGSWVSGNVIKLPNRPMYKVKTYNNKEYVMTDNHINATLRGEVPTSALNEGDYLLFNTMMAKAIPEYDEKLSYEQGLLIGAFLGDGSLGIERKGIIYDVTLSFNSDKIDKLKTSIDYAIKDCGGFGKMIVGKCLHNTYHCHISSKEVADFIIKWTNWKRGTYAFNKELNLNTLIQSIDFRYGILDGWYATDGGNSNRCYTTSPRLAECMEAMLTSLGINCVINVSDRTDEKVIIRGEEFNRNYPLYCVRFYEDGNHRMNKDNNHSWIKRNNSIYQRIKSIEPIEYTDAVYCVEMKNQNEPYFTLPSGLITHNCRVLNEMSENTFSSTTGMTGVMTGSCNVITLNINRIVQNFFKENTLLSNSPDAFYNNFKPYLIDILKRVYKYHIAYKTMLYETEAKGMFAASNGNYIYMKKLYSTIGVIGYFEAAKFLGLDITNNNDYKEFLQFILGTIKEQNKLNSIRDKKRPFLFNTEAIPGENLAVKFYQWDKADGYVVPKDQSLYNSYFYNPWDDTSVLDKLKLHGRDVNTYTDGGQACHLNLSEHLSKEQYQKLIDIAIAEGANYFTFNIPMSECKDCGHTVNAPVEECPICGSKNIRYWTRIIGYLVPVDNWSNERQQEFKQRKFKKYDDA